MDYFMKEGKLNSKKIQRDVKENKFKCMKRSGRYRLLVMELVSQVSKFKINKRYSIGNIFNDVMCCVVTDDSYPRGHDPRVLGFSPASNFLLNGVSAFPSAPPHTCSWSSLSLSDKDKF